MQPARVYLTPGLFGFARLAGIEYFQHVQAALEQRFRARGRIVEIYAADVHPTASIRRRAARLAWLVHTTAGSDDGPIHLVGHSTGGLDARMVASPNARLEDGLHPPMGWVERLRSVTTLNTPHYGTPLAGFFVTAKGQQLLYSVSAITIAAIRLGGPPLVATAALVAALGRTRERRILELELSDRVTDALLRALDEASSIELQSWLRHVREDRGAMMQLTPESMDLFQASVGDRPGLRTQCVASYAPPGRAGDWLRHLRSPWAAVSAALFHLLQRLTALRDPRYPCMPADGADRVLVLHLGGIPPVGANDGVVPLRSQLWGTPVWVGRADHLDVVGYFRGRGDHADWLSSGARFDRRGFETVMDRIVSGMIEGEGAISRESAGQLRPSRQMRSK